MFAASASTCSAKFFHLLHSNFHFPIMTIFLPIRVVAFETDFAGVVSNTRYLEYMERGRYAMLQAANLKVTEMLAQHGVQPIVRRVEMDYLIPARHEDDLILRIESGEFKRSSFTLEYELTRPSDGAVLMRALHTMAFINERWRAVRVPEWFRHTFSAQAAQVLAEVEQSKSQSKNT